MIFTLIYLMVGIGCAIRGWEVCADDYTWYENVAAFCGVALVWPVFLGYFIAKRFDD